MTLENPINFSVFFSAWSSFAAFSSYVQAGIDILSILCLLRYPKIQWMILGVAPFFGNPHII